MPVVVVVVLVVYLFSSKDKNLTWTASHEYNSNIDQFFEVFFLKITTDSFITVVCGIRTICTEVT